MRQGSDLISYGRSNRNGETIQRKMDYRQPKSSPTIVPLNLRWSNTWDIAKAGDDVPGESRILAKDRISAGGERSCDLGFIVDPSLYSEFCRRTRLRDRP